MLNTLKEYTIEWILNVNVSKTKVVIFRNGGKMSDLESWSYNEQKLEVVNTFLCYLTSIENFYKHKNTCM